MSRVAVVGTSCSGKTTLARRIAELTGIPHHELDTLFWRPNWTPAPIDEFRAAVEAIVAGEQWVIDGNYSRVRDIIWPRATELVWLDLPFPVVLWRAVTRTARRVITQEELFAGNRETIRFVLFDRESILWWVISTHHRRRRTYQVQFRERAGLPFTVHRIRNPADAGQMLVKLSGGE
jgi:adenylate kinase family enzyme